MEQIKQKRKRTVNTTHEQYEIYLSFLENDYILRSGTINPTVEADYIEKKWKELCSLLNSCATGPELNVAGWKKRFNDWKNATRAKYRNIYENSKKTGGGESDKIKLSSIEERGLAVWGKCAVTGTPNVRICGGFQNLKTISTLEKNQETFSIINTSQETISLAEIGQIHQKSQETFPVASTSEETIIFPGTSKEGDPEIFDFTIEMSNDNMKQFDVGADIVFEKLSTTDNTENERNALADTTNTASSSKSNAKRAYKKKAPRTFNDTAQLMIKYCEENVSLHKTLNENVTSALQIYKKLEEQKIEIEKQKLKFKIAKYKFENSNFIFDL